MQIYIHIPFCESKCPYCAFGSFSDKFSCVKSYFNAILTEIKATKIEGKISTIFIGGGTPSSVEAEFYGEIFEILRPKFAKNIEISAEANPNSASLKWLESMRNFGLNRVSFGVQSFDEKKLKFLGRIHTANAAKNAVENAKTAGIKNINIDLIYATKFDTKKLLENEARNIANLGVSSVSAYSLMLEKNTPFFGKKNYKKDSAILAKFFINLVENLGFEQYEISNFGRICRHNLGYWGGKDYLGFGAFSVGTLKNRRFYAPQNLGEYIKNPLKKDVEILSEPDLLKEHIFMGLRSVLGVEISRLDEGILKRAKILKNEGKIFVKNGRIFNKNFLLADEIYLFLT